jgi:oxygen-independent coproporphyrinogen-3 oxidase
MTAQKGENLSIIGEGKNSFETGSLGLYLHVPFCAKACEFCAFYKESADRKKIDAYLEAIELELENFPPTKPVTTIFFGGGTPTLLSAEDLDRLCSAVRRVAPNPIEWTIECAPATLKKDKIEVLKKHGVNRFSLGVQSFSPTVLEAIGRPHTTKQTQEAIELLKSETQNWNIDLIFAAADSTMGEWERDLQAAIELNPNHISTYCLTFESDTALFLKMLKDTKKGSNKKPSAEEEARFYLKTWEILRGAGYHHYELANFARARFECKHNLSTWHMNEWLGYGPSAASQVKLKDSFYRYSNISDLDAWAKGVKDKKRVLVEEETLTSLQMSADAIMFALRLVDGVDVEKIQERFGCLEENKLKSLGDSLEEEKLLVRSGTHWRLTDEGLLLADRIGEEILSAFF